MKTPHAILVGLALISAAIFFREPSVKPAHAALTGADGFQCSANSCFVLDGDRIYAQSLGAPEVNWRWKGGSTVPDLTG